MGLMQHTLHSGQQAVLPCFSFWCLGTCSYAASLCALLLAAVRDNVTFGKPYDEERWRMCVDACCLASDLEVLPAGTPARSLLDLPAKNDCWRDSLHEGIRFLQTAATCANGGGRWGCVSSVVIMAGQRGMGKGAADHYERLSPAHAITSCTPLPQLDYVCPPFFSLPAAVGKVGKVRHMPAPPYSALMPLFRFQAPTPRLVRRAST